MHGAPGDAAQGPVTEVPVTHKEHCQGRRETFTTPPAAQRCHVPAWVPSRQRHGQCR